MRAVQFDQHGEPKDVLHLSEVAVPACGPGQARVRMLLSPINPSDLLRVRGKYGPVPHLPMSPGFEGVGIVEEVHNILASKVLGVKRGRKVVVLNQTTGNWQEQVVVPALRAFPVPEGVPDEQAAGYFVNPATAYIMVKHVLKVPVGAWLLQSAAGSALGKMIIKLGNKFGYKTINIVRRQDTAETLTKLGATAIIDSSKEDVVEGVKNLTDQEGVKYALDPVGGMTTTQIIQSLGQGGKVLLYGSLDWSPSQILARHLIQNDITIQGFSLPQWTARKKPLQMLFLMKQIGTLMQEGILTADIAQVFPLEQFQEAIQAAESAGRQGKVLLKIGS